MTDLSGGFEKNLQCQIVIGLLDSLYHLVLLHGDQTLALLWGGCEVEELGRTA